MSAADDKEIAMYANYNDHVQCTCICMLLREYSID